MKDTIYNIEILPKHQWSKDVQKLEISHRELEVFSAIVEGYSYKEAAQILYIKYQTVKNYIHNLGKKLGAKNNIQIMIIATVYKMIKVRTKPHYFPQQSIERSLEYINDAFEKMLGGNTKVDEASEENKKIIEDKAYGLFFASTFYDKLVREKKDVAYYGDKITVEDSDKVLMRWKLSKDKYRVVFGNLTRKSVTAEKLAELEKLTLE